MVIISPKILITGTLLTTRVRSQINSIINIKRVLHQNSDLRDLPLNEGFDNVAFTAPKGDSAGVQISFSIISKLIIC